MTRYTLRVTKPSILVRTLLIWLVANMAGFLVGSLLGATDGGWISGQLTGSLARVGLVVGDLVFGACIGLAQWLVLRALHWRGLSAWWIALTAVGFLVGARLGPIVSFRLATETTALAIVFGVVMGAAQGLATWWLVRRMTARSFLWILVMTMAWIVGESIAFRLDFSHWGVPMVGAAISAVTGLYLFTLNGTVSSPRPTGAAS